MSLFGWKQSKEEEVGEVVVRREPAASDAPFRLEFAPGIMLIEAEIRDRKSLEVFVNTLKAMGALLPNDVETPALPEPASAPPEPPKAPPIINVTPPPNTGVGAPTPTGTPVVALDPFPADARLL